MTIRSVSAGTPVNAYAGSNGHDSETTIAAAVNVDLLQYKLPAMVEGLSVALLKTDATGAGAVSATNTSGVSIGYTVGALSLAMRSPTTKLPQTPIHAPQSVRSTTSAWLSFQQAHKRTSS